MPKDTIERAVTKGISKDAEATEAITYEAYGPGGVAMMIDTLTDNRNRTAQEIKHTQIISDKTFSLNPHHHCFFAIGRYHTHTVGFGLTSARRRMWKSRRSQRG